MADSAPDRCFQAVASEFPQNIPILPKHLTDSLTHCFYALFTRLAWVFLGVSRIQNVSAVPQDFDRPLDQKAPRSIRPVIPPSAIDKRKEEEMAQLMNRRKRMRLMLLFAAALGCSSAALSGTLSVFSYTADRPAEASAVHQF